MSHDKRRGTNKAAPAVLTESEVQLEELKSKVKQKGENLVKEIFPKKVIELTNLIESEKLSLTRLKDMSVKLNIPVPDDETPIVNCNASNSNCENPKKRKLDCVLEPETTGTKVFSIPGGMVPVNPNLVEILDIIKPEAIELVEYANQVKMWITFMIPKIEDGNNFGVSIQEDAISEARQVESEAATYLDQISRYYLTRGKMIAKAAKYPHVEDFRRTVQEVDEKEFLSLKLILTELRNNYASLHDLISKNLDKIKKPRSANTDNMY